MPELDDDQWGKIRHDSILVAGLWLTAAMAGERHDKFAAREACTAISKLTRTTFALVKQLDAEVTEASNG